MGRRLRAFGLAAILATAPSMNGCANRAVIRDGRYAGQKKEIDGGEVLKKAGRLNGGLLGLGLEFIGEALSNDGKPVIINTSVTPRYAGTSTSYNPRKLTPDDITQPRIVADRSNGIVPYQSHCEVLFPRGMSYEGATFRWSVDGTPIPGNHRATLDFERPGQYIVIVDMTLPDGTFSDSKEYFQALPRFDGATSR
jgi:hypothetical protein